MTMETVARFEKVSIKEFVEACKKTGLDFSPEKIREIYEKIVLPKRATIGSAGYDFFSPVDFTLQKGESITFPTGIRCKMNKGWVLTMYPRSGMGFKTGVRFANTVGIIDSDYYFSDNEGHIMAKFVNDGVMGKPVEVKAGSAVCQGIFLPFGVAEDDCVTTIRNGGFGSTGTN